MKNLLFVSNIEKDFFKVHKDIKNKIFNCRLMALLKIETNLLNSDLYSFISFNRFKIKEYYGNYKEIRISISKQDKFKNLHFNLFIPNKFISKIKFLKKESLFNFYYNIYMEILTRGQEFEFCKKQNDDICFVSSMVFNEKIDIQDFKNLREIRLNLLALFHSEIKNADESNFKKKRFSIIELYKNTEKYSINIKEDKKNILRIIVKIPIQKIKYLSKQNIEDEIGDFYADLYVDILEQAYFFTIKNIYKES